jgi:hypothetical protein
MSSISCPSSSSMDQSGKKKNKFSRISSHRPRCWLNFILFVSFLIIKEFNIVWNHYSWRISFIYTLNIFIYLESFSTTLLLLSSSFLWLILVYLSIKNYRLKMYSRDFLNLLSLPHLFFCLFFSFICYSLTFLKYIRNPIDKYSKNGVPCCWSYINIYIYLYI